MKEGSEGSVVSCVKGIMFSLTDGQKQNENSNQPSNFALISLVNNHSKFESVLS